MKNKNLDILKKIGTGFKTPSGYFDTVEDAVLAKLTVEKFPLKEGFIIPDHYFDTVEDTVSNYLAREELLQKSTFDVPKDYFDTIEDKVFDKIQKEDTNQPKVIGLNSKFLKIITPIAIAASLVLFLMINYNSNNNDSFDNLAATDVENWIENDLITLDAYEIAEVFNDITLEDDFSDDDMDILEYMDGTDIESVLLTD